LSNGRDYLLDALDAVRLKLDRRQDIVGRQQSGGHTDAKGRSGVDQAYVEALLGYSLDGVPKLRASFGQGYLLQVCQSDI
jgi:hypothetical protein